MCTLGDGQSKAALDGIEAARKQMGKFRVAAYATHEHLCCRKIFRASGNLGVVSALQLFLGRGES